VTVYFACRPSEPNLIKIGFSEDVEQRMAALMSGFDDGIELLAQCEGDQAVESGFHKLFETTRNEGEWFERSDLLNGLIEAFSGNVKGRRVFERTKASGAGSRAEEDQIIAANLLGEVAAFIAPDRSVGIKQEAVFGSLKSVNPMWSRRRVRAMWERSARRIELYEIRDLLSLLPTRKAMQSQMGRLRGMDLPGAEQ
jgi:hypothetical protein